MISCVLCASVKATALLCTEKILSIIKQKKFVNRLLVNLEDPLAKTSFQLEKGEFLDNLELVRKNVISWESCASFKATDLLWAEKILSEY